jgi:predicted nicotinamide N-methyase
MVLEIIEKLKESSKSSKSTQDFIEFEDGTILWNASLVLLNYICEHEGSLKGKRVLELGSGLGHLAVGLSRCRRQTVHAGFTCLTVLNQNRAFCNY